jgi:hypothetical protein
VSGIKIYQSGLVTFDNTIPVGTHEYTITYVKSQYTTSFTDQIIITISDLPSEIKTNDDIGSKDYLESGITKQYFVSDSDFQGGT